MYIWFPAADLRRICWCLLIIKFRKMIAIGLVSPQRAWVLAWKVITRPSRLEQATVIPWIYSNFYYIELHNFSFIYRIHVHCWQEEILL